jgi:hypothetical protein
MSGAWHWGQSFKSVCIAHNAKMAGFDPELSVEVTGNHILITLPGTPYSVTYFKPRGQPWLAAKDIVHEDDPRIAMTSAEFLAKAWKVANDKARDLGWIV